MLEHPRAAPSVIYWPNAVRVALLSLVRAVQEIWHGLDTWSAITQGVVPMNGDEQEQLAVRGDIDALATRANAGDEYASELLSRLIAERLETR
jgi:hypothetical protein